MKSFWKYTLASIVGGIITFFLIFGIIFGMFSSSLSNIGKSDVVIKDNSVLKISLSNEIPDQTSGNPFDYISFPSFETRKNLGLNDILKTIEKAKTDDRIKGIYLDLEYIEAGFSSVEEIRNKLLEFKETGKFILSYSSNYSQKAYYLATVADKIYLNPQGSLLWKGMSSQVTFYTKMMEKLGIEAQIFRHGQFKSAVEPFMNTEMSEANKLQSLTLIQSIWDDMCKKISGRRGISVETLNSLADNLSVYNAETSIEHKMVDELKYYDEVIAELKNKSGSKGEDDDIFVGLTKYSKAKSENIIKNTSSNKIAVIFAEGDIIDGDKTSGSIAGNDMSKMIRKAREDKDVKAVVLRVNSPGGSALASDIIWREVKLTNEVKPVVVSMGNYAASGGYYISCAAKYIFAQPNTLTGSIGVFGMLPNFQKLMNDKIGITFDGVKTNKSGDFGSTIRPVTEAERAYFQNNVENVYDTFISRVSEGRKMTKEEVDLIGQGRVWSGINALEIKLVDGIGGLNDAVKKAAELASLSNDYVIREYPEKEDVIRQLVKEVSENASYNVTKEVLGENYKFFKTIETVKNLEGIQTRMEYDIEIY